MKKIIIYESIHHGNTEKIAHALAETLRADFKKAHEVSPEALKNYDLIGFGSGVYFLKLHQQLFKLAEQIDSLKNKQCFIFSTSGSSFGKFSHRKLRFILKQKEAEILGEFSCKGFDTYGIFGILGGINKGKPSEKDLEKARNFALELRKKKTVR